MLSMLRVAKAAPRPVKTFKRVGNTSHVTYNAHDVAKRQGDAKRRVSVLGSRRRHVRVTGRRKTIALTPRSQKKTKKKKKNITAVDAPHCSRPSGAYSTNNPLTHCEPAERGHQASSVLAQLGLSGHHSHPFTRDPIEGGLYHIPIGEREVDHQSMTHCKYAFDYSLGALTPQLGIGDTS